MRTIIDCSWNAVVISVIITSVTYTISVRIQLIWIRHGRTVIANIS
ncbi:hypothetical protein X975_26238, partial [Stegodyphus mimosarum]